MDTLAARSGEVEARPVYMPVLKGMVSVLNRADLYPGFEFAGPAIVTEKAATSWIAGGWKASVDDWGHLHLRLSG